MAFTVPTLDELSDFLVAMLKSLFPEQDVSRASFPAILAKTLAAAATDNHAHLVSVRADLLPDTAEGEALDRWGAILGVTRKGATPARKASALRLINNSGTNESVTVGQELVHASGLRFSINENSSILAGTEQDVDVVAIDTGSATRLDAGEVLTFTTPTTYIEETAELQLDLDEDGDDAEADGDYRRRILARLSTPPLGGAQSDYVAWALEVTGVAAAYCYPSRAGLGTVDVAALHAGTGSARLLTLTERSDLLDYIEERRPVHATVRVLEVVEEETSVEVRVLSTGESAYDWDWNDETALIVSTWTAGTRTLVFTTARPDTMQAGHRLVIKKALGTGDGELCTIESLSSTDAVVLEEAPSVAPANLDEVYAGGALTDPVRDAIIEHINGLGTANPDAAPYGSWESALRLAGLYRVINGVEGVLDSVLVAPVANVEPEDPAFPDDDTINVLTPARILVRRKW
jgi:uncharacterized phage protein gp47/JayE